MTQQDVILYVMDCPVSMPPEKELRGLSPNFHINVSVSDLYIHAIGLPLLLQTHECGNWD